MPFTGGGNRNERLPFGDWHALLVLVMAGFLPNEVWRMIGLWLGGGVDEGSEVLVWVRAVATAILAGVIAQILVQPPGALASVPGLAALCRGGRRICGLYRDPAVDLGRRGLRRARDAGWQMVARVIRFWRYERQRWFETRNCAKVNSPSRCRRRTTPGSIFIGRIRTPWTSREDTPRQGRHDGPVCRLEIFEPWVPALKGVDFYTNLEVIYWLHHSRRDLVLQSPKNNQSTRGTFSLRSPVRPNPIGTSIVKLVGIEGNIVFVRGLDCLDETPLLDIKPDRCEFTPLAQRRRGMSRRSNLSLYRRDEARTQMRLRRDRIRVRCSHRPG